MELGSRTPGNRVQINSLNFRGQAYAGRGFLNVCYLGVQWI